jgi:hypothetical protein
LHFNLKTRARFIGILQGAVVQTNKEISRLEYSLKSSSAPTTGKETKHEGSGASTYSISAAAKTKKMRPCKTIVTSFAGGAPWCSFELPLNKSLIYKNRKTLQCGSFVLRIHKNVGMFPFSNDS